LLSVEIGIKKPSLPGQHLIINQLIPLRYEDNVPLFYRYCEVWQHRIESVGCYILDLSLCGGKHCYAPSASPRAPPQDGVAVSNWHFWLLVL